MRDLKAELRAAYLANLQDVWTRAVEFPSNGGRPSWREAAGLPPEDGIYWGDGDPYVPAEPRKPRLDPEHLVMEYLEPLLSRRLRYGFDPELGEPRYVWLSEDDPDWTARAVAAIDGDDGDDDADDATDYRPTGQVIPRSFVRDAVARLVLGLEVPDGAARTVRVAILETQRLAETHGEGWERWSRRVLAELADALDADSYCVPRHRDTAPMAPQTRMRGAVVPAQVAAGEAEVSAWLAAVEPGRHKRADLWRQFDSERTSVAFRIGRAGFNRLAVQQFGAAVKVRGEYVYKVKGGDMATLSATTEAVVERAAAMLAADARAELSEHLAMARASETLAEGVPLRLVGGDRA